MDTKVQRTFLWRPQVLLLYLFFEGWGGRSKPMAKEEWKAWCGWALKKILYVDTDNQDGASQNQVLGQSMKNRI